MGIGLKQFECLGVLPGDFRVAPQETCGAPVVLLGKNELPRHLCRQFGQALDVLFDRFLDESAGVQIRLRFSQGGLQFALAQVRVLLATHDDVFRLAADRHRGLLLVCERLFYGADALGLQIVCGDCVHVSRTINHLIDRIINSVVKFGKRWHNLETRAGRGFPVDCLGQRRPRQNLMNK